MNVITWIKATRLYSLPVSMASVVMSVAISSQFCEIKWLPASICLIFAILAQITSNFVNDYADFKKGADDMRLGSERMVASGKISPDAMKRAAVITIIAAFLIGCTLLYWGGWILLPIGIVIIISALAYTAGPFPLAYHALGDVAVIIFYGIIPTTLTFFIQTGFLNLEIVFAGLAIGLVTNELLIVNNYRDVNLDTVHNKKTTVVVFGRKFMSFIYLLNPFIASALSFLFLKNILDFKINIIIFLPFLFYSVFLWSRLKKLNDKELNKLVGMSSMSAVIFAATVIIAIIIS